MVIHALCHLPAIDIEHIFSDEPHPEPLCEQGDAPELSHVHHEATVMEFCDHVA